jgi:hypothetical protein
MMKQLLIPCAIALILLTGCAPRYQQSSYQKQTAGASNAQIFVDTGNRVTSVVNECLDKAYKDPISQLVTKEVLFAKLDSPNKIELMTSIAKISPSQAKALLAYIQINTPCRQEVMRILFAYPQISSLYSSHYGNVDILYSDLLSKRITIGEANKQKALLLEKFSNDRNLAIKSAMEGYQNQDYRERQIQAQAAQVEATNNAARTAIASQYLQNMSNQQSNMAQYYQNQSQNYINQMNSAPRQAPYLNAPQQQTAPQSVNCLPNGVGGFRCQ